MTIRPFDLLRIRRMVVKEIRQLFRDPKTKRIIFAAPIIQLLAFGYAVNTDVRDVETALLDQDRTEASRSLVRAFQLLLDGSNSNTATVAQGYAAEIVQAFGARVARSSGFTGAGLDLRTRAWFNPSLESRVYNVPAVIGVIIMMMCLMLTSLGIVRERELGTLEQLLVSPLTPGELILGKTIPVAGIALLQLSLVTTVALLWFRIPFTGSVLTLLLAAGLFILSGLAVGLYISAISNTQQEAFLSMYMFFLPAIILSGFLYPIDTMPTVFRHLTVLNPLRHFLDVVRGVFLKGADLADVWLPCLALAAMAVLGLVIATRRFRNTL